MVRTVSHQTSMQKSKSFKLKRMLELPGRKRHSLSFEAVHDGSHDSQASMECPLENQKIGCVYSPELSPVSCFKSAGRGHGSPLHMPSSDVEMMMSRFAKLLLGEDMSGGGKGVSSALALSNAITNLAASVFGEHKLQPLSFEKKARWRKEIKWLLSVTDHIVELVPAKQKSKDGIDMEVMVTRQRSDLLMNIPALQKLDAMLIEVLDQFGNQTEFWYASADEDSDFQRNDDKWWLPTAKVPPKGLSEVSRKWLHFLKDSVNQVLKAAMAINAQVLSEMEVPESYVESLPKNGKTSLGDAIYKAITDDYFDPGEFFSSIDLSTEHKVVDLKNRIEASIVIWKRKMHHMEGKSSWNSMSFEKREILEERVETILFLLKQRFPGIPQSALDICKIQCNKDVGQAILESYSRIVESLAFKILSGIEDVLQADKLKAKSSKNRSMDSLSIRRHKGDAEENPGSAKTLSDIMGWHVNIGESKEKKNSMGNIDCLLREENNKLPGKPPNLVTPKRFSYLEKLESASATRSPTARH